jgi:hypothetical protein
LKGASCTPPLSTFSRRQADAFFDLGERYPFGLLRTFFKIRHELFIASMAFDFASEIVNGVDYKPCSVIGPKNNVFFSRLIEQSLNGTRSL